MPSYDASRFDEAVSDSPSTYIIHKLHTVFHLNSFGCCTISIRHIYFILLVTVYWACMRDCMRERKRAFDRLGYLHAAPLAFFSGCDLLRKRLLSFLYKNEVFNIIKHKVYPMCLLCSTAVLLLKTAPTVCSSSQAIIAVVYMEPSSVPLLS